MRHIFFLAAMFLMLTALLVRAEDHSISSRAPSDQPRDAVCTDTDDRSDGHRRPAALPFLYGSLVFLQTYDMSVTLSLKRAGAVEANPFMKPLIESPVAFVLVKSGVTAASIISAERLWHKHHRVEAVMMLVVTNGIMGLVAIRNTSLRNAVRR
jgi:hypothetical protein